MKTLMIEERLGESLQRLEFAIRHQIAKIRATAVRLYTDEFCRLIAYLLILVATFSAVAIFFNEGYYNGHDSIFHATQIQSYIESLKSGDFSGWISPGLLKKDLGPSIRMMYSSLGHSVTAWLYVFLLEPLGFTMTTAYKLTIAVSFFVSGLTAYELGLRLTKKHQILSLLFGLVFAFNPYHFTLIYVRDAFAENFAYQFIPLFFLALHAMIHPADEDKPLAFGPYACLMFSIGLLLLSHNITALFTALFGAVYLLVNLKCFLRLFKKPLFYPFALVAVTGAVLMYLPIFVPFVVQSDLNIRLYKDVMNANFEGIASSYSGTWSFFYYSFNLDFFLGTLAIAGAAVVGNIAAQALLKRWKYTKYLSSAMIAIATIAASILYYYRAWSLSHAAILLVFGLLLSLFVLLRSSAKPREWERKAQISDIISYLVLLAIAVLLISSVEVWKYLPSILYRIQFQFRLWTYVILFADAALILIMKKISEKIKSVDLVFPLLLLPIMTSFRYTTPSILPLYGEEWKKENIPADQMVALGWQYEYLSDYFFSDLDVDNTPPIYYEVYRNLFYDYSSTLVPTLLNGGEVLDYHFSSSKGASFSLTKIDSGTRVILPIFYYHGYDVLYTDPAGETSRLKNYNDHGLICFDIPAGANGEYQITYSGTTSMRAANALFLSFLLLNLVALGAVSVHKKWRRCTLSAKL